MGTYLQHLIDYPQKRINMVRNIKEDAFIAEP
jgi:hypothetical protein